MNNFVKATIRRLVDLPWEDFRDLFSWSSHGTIQAENPNLLVAKASDGKGETIAFVTAEPILLVGSYVLSPTITPDEAAITGDAIDKSLAQQAGVNKFWIIVPPEAPVMKGEKRIRVMERRVYQPPTNTQTRVTWEVKEHVATGFIN
jgi:hypothetical protein